VLADLAEAATAGGTTLAEAAWNIPRTLGAAVTPPPPGVSVAAQPARPTLIWDVDGILAFTAEALCAVLNARYYTAYKALTQTFFPGKLVPAMLPADQAAWLINQMTGFTLAGNMAPDWHAADTMTAAVTAGYPVRIVTERPVPHGPLTLQWLQDWGVSPVPQVTAVGAGNKPAWLTARYGPGNPAVLIDDNPVTRLTVASPGIEVWLPARPYVPTTGRAYTRVFAGWQEARGWLGLA